MVMLFHRQPQLIPKPNMITFDNTINKGELTLFGCSINSSFKFGMSFSSLCGDYNICSIFGNLESNSLGRKKNGT